MKNLRDQVWKDTNGKMIEFYEALTRQGNVAFTGGKRIKENVLFWNEIQHREIFTTEDGCLINSKEAGSAVINFTWNKKER